MDEARAIRLEARYSGNRKQSEKKQLEIGPGRGRSRAMGSSGKPKDTKAAIMRLLKYISHEKLIITVAICCSILHTVSALTASYLLRPIINRFIYFDAVNDDLTERIHRLAVWLTFLAIIYGISLITQWLQQRLMLEASQRTLARMRSELFAKMQTLPVCYFDTHSIGDMMSRFTNDVDSVC